MKLFVYTPADIGGWPEAQGKGLVTGEYPSSGHAPVTDYYFTLPDTDISWIPYRIGTANVMRWLELPAREAKNSPMTRP